MNESNQERQFSRESSSELINRLSFEVNLHDEYKETELYLLGDFNDYGWKQENGAWRKLVEDELDEFRFSHEGSKYKPPEIIKDLKPGSEFKIFVKTPAIVPETEFSLLEKYSLRDLFLSSSEAEGRYEKIMGKIEGGLNALLELEDLGTSGDQAHEEFLGKLQNFTLRDMRKYWNYGKRSWDLDKLDPQSGELFVLAERLLFDELFELEGKGKDDDYRKYSISGRAESENEMLHAFEQGGLMLDGVEERSFQAEDGQSYSQPCYWMVANSFDSEIGEYGKYNIYTVKQ